MAICVREGRHSTEVACRDVPLRRSTGRSWSEQVGKSRTTAAKARRVAKIAI